MKGKEPRSSVVAAVRSALVATAVAASAWMALVLWRPTTTWHLAPAIVSGAGAWTAAQSFTRPTRLAARWIGGIAAFGFAVAWAQIELLEAQGRLAGPALVGNNVALESIATAAASAAIAAHLGIRGATRARLAEREERRMRG